MNNDRQLNGGACGAPLNARSIRGPHCSANALDAKEIEKRLSASPQHSKRLTLPLLSHTMPHVTVLYFAKLRRSSAFYEVTISMLERRHVISFWDESECCPAATAASAG